MFRKPKRWGNRKNWRLNQMFWTLDALDFLDKEMLSKDPTSYHLTRAGAASIAWPEVIEANPITERFADLGARKVR